MVGSEKSDQKWLKSEPKSRNSQNRVTLVGFFKNSEAVNIKGPSCPTVGQLLDGFGVISSIRGHFGPLLVEILKMGHTFWHFSSIFEKTLKKWSRKEGLCP